MTERTTGQMALEAEIAQLRDLGLHELRERWRALYGRPAPRFFRRKFLLRALAYQMQAKLYGGLSAATKRRLYDIAAAVRAGNEEAIIPFPRIKPGTRLIRRWQDTTHIVTVLPGGFEWQGQQFGTLSAVANAITGGNWNGYAFFGLKRRSTKNKNAAGPRRVRNA